MGKIRLTFNNKKTVLKDSESLIFLHFRTNTLELISPFHNPTKFLFKFMISWILAIHTQLTHFYLWIFFSFKRLIRNKGINVLCLALYPILEGEEKELCFLLSFSSVLQLTSHVVYQASPHLTASTSHDTLAQARCFKQASGSPPHMTHSLEPLNCHSVPLPQPRITASLPSAKQHLSPISKHCSALPCSRKPVSKIC